MTVTVLQLSDLHLASDPTQPVLGHDADGRLRSVLAAWRRTERTADLVVLSGDIADDGSAGAYARVREAAGALGAPVVALPGNHDDPRLVREAFGDEAVLDLGTWVMVALDTARPPQMHGTIDVDAALDLLDAHDGRPTAVAMHHPPTSRSTHEWFQLEGADAFVDGIARRPHVRLLMSGHLHDAFDIALGGATLLGAPSTLSAIAHDGDRMEFDADAPRGARIVSLHDDGTHTSELVIA